MTTQEIRNVLNQGSEFGVKQKRLLKRYLNEQIARYDCGEDVPNDIAYEIAGLMNADSIWRLPKDDPYKRMFRMAGYLELPDAHHEPGDSWDELKRRIASLP